MRSPPCRAPRHGLGRRRVRARRPLRSPRAARAVARPRAPPGDRERPRFPPPPAARAFFASCCWTPRERRALERRRARAPPPARVANTRMSRRPRVQPRGAPGEPRRERTRARRRVPHRGSARRRAPNDVAGGERPRVRRAHRRGNEWGEEPGRGATTDFWSARAGGHRLTQIFSPTLDSILNFRRGASLLSLASPRLLTLR